MIRFSSLSFFFLLFSFFGYAQETTGELDSLKQLFAQTSEKETQLELLKLLVKREHEPDSIFKYGSLALEAGEQLNDYEKFKNVLDSITIYIWNKRAYKTLIRLTVNGIDYIQEQKDTFELARKYSNLGLCHELTGNYEQSIEYNLEAEKFGMISDNKKLLSVIYSSLGRVYKYEYEDSLALIYMHKGLERAFLDKQWEPYSVACNGLGLFYFHNEDYRQAIEYFEKINLIRDSINNRKLLASPYSNLGAAYSRIGETEKAIQYLERSVALYTEVKGFHELGAPYEGLGIAYRKKLDYEKSLEYHRKAYKIRKDYNLIRSIPPSITNITLLLAETGRPKQALQFLQAENMLGDRLDEFKSWEQAQAVATTYEKLKDYKNALKYQQMAFVFKDSLVNETQTRTLKEMEARFKNKQKQAELDLANTRNDLLESEKAAARNMNYGLGIGVLLSFLTILFLIRFLQARKIQNQQLESNNQTLLKLNEGISEELKEKENQLISPEIIANKTITLTSNGKEVVRLGDITYFKAEGKAVQIFTKEHSKPFWDWVTLGSYEKLLPEQLFLKIQRSYVVNILEIKSRKANSLVMSDGKEINIGKTQKEKVNNTLNKRTLNQR